MLAGAAMLAALAAGLTVDEIPRQNSAKSGTVCGSTTDPGNSLSDCTTPLAAGTIDLRGTWERRWPNGTLIGAQRIEQCGDRLTVTAQAPNGYWGVHDFPHANGEWSSGCQDYNVFFMPACSPMPVPPAGAVIGTFDAAEVHPGGVGCMVMSLATPTTLLRAATRCLNTDGTMRFWNIQIGGAGWDFTRTPLPSGPCVRVRGQVPAMCGALPTEAIVGIAVGGALLLAAGVLMVRRRGGRGKGSSAGKGQAKAHA